MKRIYLKIRLRPKLLDPEALEVLGTLVVEGFVAGFRIQFDARLV